MNNKTQIQEFNERAAKLRTFFHESENLHKRLEATHPLPKKENVPESIISVFLTVSLMMVGTVSYVWMVF